MRYGVPADTISVPADSAAAVVKFTISIPRESCTNEKAKYSSSVVPPDHSVHFYHCIRCSVNGALAGSDCLRVKKLRSNIRNSYHFHHSCHSV